MPGMIEDDKQKGHNAERSQAERRKSKTWDTTSHLHVANRDRDSLRSCALIAQITVLADMNTAPSAGVRMTPRGKNTPAAAGMANVL